MVVLVVVMAMVALMAIVMNDVRDGDDRPISMVLPRVRCAPCEVRGEVKHITKKTRANKKQTTIKTNNKVLPGRASEHDATVGPNKAQHIATCH